MKSLQQNNLIKAPFDISWLLEKDILRISKILTSRGANLYAVGGSVRASYWKEEFDNIDFAINITPHEVKELLKNIRCNIIQTGIEYGTLSVIINKKLFEITSFRKDIETFGRKAIVKYTNCIKQDAKRRDFTFNAIYLNMKGEIVDPLGNFSDLAKGKVKFVGDPKKRILEDHLRILRFFRFLSKYPLQNKRVNFRTLKTINETKDLVKKLSKERIWREFKMILSSDGASLALRFMNKTGVLKVLFPSFTLKRAINLIALEEIFIKNKILCLPVIEKKNSHLIFKQFKSEENFVKGHMNISEPQNKNRILNPELIFVPCLAFDKKGNRLGYGGGYYDRTFAYLNKINHRFISVAYAYEEQKLDYIPIDKFDFKVDYVITEKNLYSFQ